jgi:hypothetical protein
MTRCEASDWTAGLLLRSSHSDDEDITNEEHNGFYVGYRWLRLGTYENSYGERSSFAGAEGVLYQKSHFTVSVFGGVVDGYQGYGGHEWEYLPMAGINVKLGFVKGWVTKGVVLYGLELPN